MATAEAAWLLAVSAIYAIGFIVDRRVPSVIRSGDVVGASAPLKSAGC
jgi:hypothetical protein